MKANEDRVVEPKAVLVMNIFDHSTPACKCGKCAELAMMVFMALGDIARLFAWCDGARLDKWDKNCAGCAEIIYTGGLWTEHTCEAHKNDPQIKFTTELT